MAVNLQIFKVFIFIFSTQQHYKYHSFHFIISLLFCFAPNPFQMFFLFFLLSFLVSFLFLFFSFHCKNLHNQKLLQKQAKPHNETTLFKPQNKENDSTHLPHSLLLEIMPSDSSKWAGFIAAQPGSGREPDGAEDPMIKKKKKKKRGKKKRLDSKSEEDQNCFCCSENEKKKREVSSGRMDPGSRVKPELVCLYPFTSTSSATQRKIKQQYDQLVKCHENKGLTLAQVGEFANCLVEARNELQNKSEVIKRKFTITNALLLKADRSSFDRLRQQICKLELEQKRLEEDAFVYNWLQQQLKLSPAYKKMLEVCTCVERNAKSDEPMVDTDAEFSDISFEELLAQEKKDSFWQKNGKSRLSSN